ncbi:VPLPA-CTERM-specific exosortase XrtD [Poseidonocella sedimentorum]|uniref:Exosortase D, VPLPA-CTERM-specific n=1 Tax=Poseidonocella sedimentorum TaxID=871652 RepID=A0A1I6ENW1_9RHOB|nr:VPLPA-CTERM-specific exosortase XrtD [Poseidonocella sedimentorum]SFR19365.1 exosortase D, VPLPA-CTERM-specific [Poseidonocella sedimentorum]
MSVTGSLAHPAAGPRDFASWGVFWFLIALIGAGVFFADGLDALLRAWSLPEYSHGPLIPILSLLLFLRHLRQVPAEPGPKRDRWPGVAVILLSIALATLGKLANISDLVAYATIVWTAGILLVSFGWRTGWVFWPSVLHLVYMLPLPGVVYYKLSTSLQYISSELGVWMLQALSVPVFLEGNIIDLGVLKLHVAEACSGLRYLFPILSFSYIFAVLYRGPGWQKAVLLISAVPITVLMNSVRIAVAGLLADRLGVEWLEGFTHFFEGWVIFLICIVLLFGLAWIMLLINPKKMSLSEALDLETEGMAAQVWRLGYLRPSPAMIATALAMVLAVGAMALMPERESGRIARDGFATFPRTLGAWEQSGPPEILSPDVARTLGADDYRSVTLIRPGAAATVGFFSAWYEDQSRGGVHSPEICLPGAGWEIAWLERTDVAPRLGLDTDFNINRAIIQKGETRMMVYYWFDQKGRKIAWDFAAKFYLMVDGIRTGRTDGALVRLTTLIRPEETDAAAEARLMEVLGEVRGVLPRFIP